jgi:hypothetical protein
MNFRMLLAKNPSRAMALAMCVVALGLYASIDRVTRPVSAAGCHSNGYCDNPCWCETGGQCVPPGTCAGGSSCVDGTWLSSQCTPPQ